MPAIPLEPVPYQRAPIDLNGREPAASTVFAVNIPYEASEERVLEYFNGINGTFRPREPNVVLAVNFAYQHFSNQFDGKAYFLYSTVELAEYAVRTLNEVPFMGRRIYVLISDERLNVRGNRSNVVGGSRAGTRIWDCTRRVSNSERSTEQRREQR